ncbi:hypothetical protein OKA04_23905, partial [Luteolibacter flavescens]
MTRRHILGIFFAAPLGLLVADDERPVVDDSQAKKEAPSSGLPTLWIAGDSTVKNQGTMRGWGQEICKGRRHGLHLFGDMGYTFGHFSCQR